MAIEFVGSATGITSATLPAHQANDLIIAFAFRDGSTSRPTLPANWTAITDNAGTTCSARLAYRVATNNSTTTGTWTSATSVIFLVYRGVFTSSIGNDSFLSGVGVTVSYNSLSIDANSWVVAFAGHRATNVNLLAPNGMTNVAYVADGTDEAAAHHTGEAVDEWLGGNTSVGGSSSGWITYTLELENLINASTTLVGIETEIFTFPEPATPDWYAWTFGNRVLIANGNAQYAVNGIEAQSEIAEIIAQATIDAELALTGIELESQAATIEAQASGSITIDGLALESNSSLIEAQGNAVNLLSGLSLDSFISTIEAQANASIDLQGSELGSQFGTLDVQGNAEALSESAELQSQTGSLIVNSDSNISISGLEAQSSIAEITASADSSSTVILTGIGLTASLGAVTATGTGEMVMVPSKESYRKPKKSVRISIIGLDMALDIGKPVASGTIIINNVAKVLSIEARLEAKAVRAEGVLNLSDEEIILLMAA